MWCPSAYSACHSSMPHHRTLPCVQPAKQAHNPDVSFYLYLAFMNVHDGCEMSNEVSVRSGVCMLQVPTGINPVCSNDARTRISIHPGGPSQGRQAGTVGDCDHLLRYHHQRHVRTHAHAKTIRTQFLRRIRPQSSQVRQLCW